MSGKHVSFFLSDAEFLALIGAMVVATIKILGCILFAVLFIDGSLDELSFEIITKEYNLKTSINLSNEKHLSSFTILEGKLELAIKELNMKIEDSDQRLGDRLGRLEDVISKAELSDDGEDYIDSQTTMPASPVATLKAR